MKKISYNQLVGILAKITGPCFCTLTTETVPTMIKSLNPYWNRVIKKTEIQVIIGNNYENSVNNRRKKEGKPPTFIADEPRWGRRIRNTSLIECNQNLYLQVRVQDNRKPTVQYLERNKRWVFRKKLEKLQPFLRKPVSAAERQGVNQEVVIRRYALENIKEIKINGTHYFLKSK
jgi:hypothetical protein